MNEGWRRKGGKLQEGNRWAGRLQGPGVAWEGSDPFSIDSYYVLKMGFPGGSDGKEPACNVGDLGQSLGWEDPLEEGMATHSIILREFHGQEEPSSLQFRRCKELDMTE